MQLEVTQSQNTLPWVFLKIGDPVGGFLWVSLYHAKRCLFLMDMVCVCVSACVFFLGTCQPFKMLAFLRWCLEREAPNDHLNHEPIWVWVKIFNHQLRPQVLVFVFTSQGNPFWGYPTLDPHPSGAFGSPFGPRLLGAGAAHRAAAQAHEGRRRRRPRGRRGRGGLGQPPDLGEALTRGKRKANSSFNQSGEME